MKQNCWEYRRCGREPGGSRASEQGVCPVFTKVSLTGVNDGLYGGRTCFLIEGTYCDGEHPCHLTDKMSVCSKCEFHSQLVFEEYGPIPNQGSSEQ